MGLLPDFSEKTWKLFRLVNWSTVYKCCQVESLQETKLTTESSTTCGYLDGCEVWTVTGPHLDLDCFT